MRRKTAGKPPVGAGRYPRDEGGETTLLLNELYASIQGEGPEQGFPVVLVRLTGCNLRCGYCDSAYSFFQGKRVGLKELTDRVKAYGCKRVLVTGGEPMVQAGTPDLCRSLIASGHLVSIETNGSFRLDPLPSEIMKIVDVKTPGSGEEGSFEASILDALDGKDALKFVCADREDYDWSKAFIAGHALPGPCTIIFSPIWGQLDRVKLAAWIIEDRLEARLQLQLHKVLWGEKRGV